MFAHVLRYLRSGDIVSLDKTSAMFKKQLYDEAVYFGILSMQQVVKRAMVPMSSMGMISQITASLAMNHKYCFVKLGSDTKDLDLSLSFFSVPSLHVQVKQANDNNVFCVLISKNSVLITQNEKAILMETKNFNPACTAELRIDSSTSNVHVRWLL